MQPPTDHHVAACWRHLQERLPLDALLALTEGRVPPGLPAWQAVLPLLDETIGPAQLQLLGSSARSPDALKCVLYACLERLRTLATWSPQQIAGAIADAAAAESMDPALARGIATSAILRMRSPLPVNDVLAVMGRDWSLSRLQHALDALVSAQLVG
jgi:hypothetical protein